MSDPESNHADRGIIAARRHEIQVNLERIDVPEFETIPEIAMAVRLATGLGSMSQGHLFDTNILLYHVNGRLDPPADEQPGHAASCSVLPGSRIEDSEIEGQLNQGWDVNALDFETP